MADQGAEGYLSPYLRRQRIEAARPFLSGRILDVGCGAGLLAEHVAPEDYIGLDIDDNSLAFARRRFPKHQFLKAQKLDYELFDTVVALAIIEHVREPAAFLAQLRGNLLPTASAQIICTTPHASLDWAHWVGARMGLFSRSANDEHEELLDRSSLDAAGRAANLTMPIYRRFLFGANQLAVYRPAALRAEAASPRPVNPAS